jgi:hypothetical protein
MQQTTQTQIIGVATQAQACEAIEKCSAAIADAMHKRGVPESQVDMILAGVAAAAVTLRDLERGKAG